MYKHAAPVLDSVWNHDGDRVFSVGCDNKAMCQDLRASKLFQVAQHEKPIRKVKWVKEFPGLVTGGWDKTCKFWDTRAPAAVATVELPERCYAMDVRYPLLVVATAERKIGMFDCRQLGKVVRWTNSPLKFQSRCLAVFPDASGFALGSVEGRVAVHFVDQSQPRNFAFKCHRKDKARIFAVNALDFHPRYGTFATAGSDGTCHFWDKDSKQRLKGFKPNRLPVSCQAFNGTGTIYAYAVSYDWHAGARAYNRQEQNQIFLHPVKDAEIMPRPMAPGAKFA